jgi:hypothetical protein
MGCSTAEKENKTSCFEKCSTIKHFSFLFYEFFISMTEIVLAESCYGVCSPDTHST